MSYNSAWTAYCVSNAHKYTVNWYLKPREVEDNRSPIVKFFRPKTFVNGPMLCYNVVLTPGWVYGITEEHRELLLDAWDSGIYHMVLEMVKTDIKKKNESDSIRKYLDKKAKAEELYSKHMGLRSSGE